MRDRERLWATIVIWISFVAIMAAMLAVMSSPAVELEAFVISNIVLVCGAAAGLSTIGIWSTAAGHDLTVQQQMQASHKAKRPTLDRLVEDLDADEIVELETLLLARDDQRRSG